MFLSDDLIGIGMEADAVRRKLHPDGVVSYIIDRNINYTNFCTEYCTFCAFYRAVEGTGAKEGYILDFETIYDKIAETVETGRHGRADAGRPASRSEDRVARADAARDSPAFSESAPALLFRVGNSGHRRVQQPQSARHDRAPARCGTGFHSGRRRGNSG